MIAPRVHRLSKLESTVLWAMRQRGLMAMKIEEIAKACEFGAKGWEGQVGDAVDKLIGAGLVQSMIIPVRTKNGGHPYRPMTLYTLTLAGYQMEMTD